MNSSLATMEDMDVVTSPTSKVTAVSIDENLSQLASSRLLVSDTREITKIRENDFCLPQQLHPGLYQRRQPQENDKKKNHNADQLLSKLTSSNLSIGTTQKVVEIIDAEAELPRLVRMGLISALPPPPPSPDSTTGVPGFPDFPNSWTGHSGWAAWSRTGEQPRKSTIRPAIRRAAVNVAGTTTPNHGYKRKQQKASKKHKAHKTDRRRKMLEKLKCKREMIALRRCMKALKC